MSNKEKCVALLDGFTEAQLVNVATVLQAMKKSLEDEWNEAPNAATIAAMEEVNEMIRTGSGQHFQGSAEDFFAMLDAEDAVDA